MHYKIIPTRRLGIEIFVGILFGPMDQPIGHVTAMSTYGALQALRNLNRKLMRGGVI